MTLTTAQGTRMRCDSPGCKDTATVEVDAWAYCNAHSGKRSSQAPTAQPPRTGHAAPPSPTPSSSSGALASPGMPQVMGGGTIGLLLEQASGHSNKRIRNLAEKIETHLDELRNRINDLAEDEKRKQAEAAAKEKARQDIARLEQQLAAAKAQLRGKAATPTPTGTKKHGGSAGRVLEQMPCRKGCGTSCNGPAGRSAHERHCTHDAATA